MSVSHGTTRSSPTGTPRDHQASARAAATTAAAVRPAGAQCHDADSLHDPLPRRGRGIRKRGCATPVPAAIRRPGAREGPRDPSRAVLAARRLARPACRDRAAQAGQRERNATAKAVSIPAAMQWLVRAPPLSFPRARCSFLSPSPLGGRGKGEGGRWRHLVPLGAPSLSLRLRLRGASPLSLRLRLRAASPLSVQPARWVTL